jgi:Tfp pilus assembly protein PilX
VVACLEERARTAWAARGRGDRAGERGTALLDIVLASVVLLVVLLPAMQLLVTSGKVVGNSRAEAIAEGVANTQIAKDRAAWTSTSSPPSYSSSPSCGSAYSATTTNSTFRLYLTGCTTVSGMPLWIFQNGGWCAPSSSVLSTIPATTVSGTTPLFWVEVMVTWGGNAPPSPTTSVAANKRLVMTSALLTPNGYGGSSTSPGCPL